MMIAADGAILSGRRLHGNAGMRELGRPGECAGMETRTELWKLDVEIPMKATCFEIFQFTAPERLVVVELLAMSAAAAAVDVVRVFALLVETLPDLGLLQDRPRLPARTPPQPAAAADRCRWLADAGAAAADFEALQRTLSG